jgi:hypothetical protein
VPFDGPRGDVDALGDLRIVETGLKIAKQLDLAGGSGATVVSCSSDGIDALSVRPSLAKI